MSQNSSPQFETLSSRTVGICQIHALVEVENDATRGFGRRTLIQESLQTLEVVLHQVVESVESMDRC